MREVLSASAQEADTHRVAETAVVVIEPGRNVYGHDGRQAEYIGLQGTRHLVRPIARFTDWQGEEYEEPTDALELWDRAYQKPPLPVVAEEIASLQAEIKERQSDLRRIADETHAAQKDTLEMLKRLGRYEPLKNLEALLNGEITHVVEGGYSSVEIKDFETAKVYRDDYSRKDVLRMLSLKPEADGAITWHLNRWSDGSGTDTPVVLCTSMEEALEAARHAILRPLGLYSFESHPHLWAMAVASAGKVGVELPDEVVAKGNAYRVSEAEAAVAKAAEALALAQTRADAAKATTAASSSSVGNREAIEPKPPAPSSTSPGTAEVGS